VIVRNFEYLLALHKERHFARAAAACHVSQPTLSAGIKQLEEDMDVRIVKRGQRFEGFTTEGERVLAWAQQMLEDCNRLKQELHELRDQGMQGAFRLGMLPATSALASTLSIAFAEQFPAIQLSIQTATAPELLHALRQGELDIALTYVDDAPGDGLDAYALYRERLFLFTTSPAPTGPRIAWDEVTALPLSLLRSSVPLPAEHQLQRAPRLLLTDSPSVLAAQVASGRWSTVLPQSLASTLTPTPNLRAIPLEMSPATSPVQAPVQANVGFVTIKANPLPSAVHALMEMAHSPTLVDAIRAMLASHKPYLLRTARKTVTAIA
jgi:DNA-binding transcriptional LysR family regulator